MDKFLFKKTPKTATAVIKTNKEVMKKGNKVNTTDLEPSTSITSSNRPRSRSPQENVTVRSFSDSSDSTENTEIKIDNHVPLQPSSSRTGNLRQKTSIVWRYFKRSSDRKLAKCITCGKEYKTSGNTTNLKDHLRRFHSIENSTNEIDQNASQSSSSSSLCSSIKSIDSYFKRANHYDIESQRQKQLDRAVIEMICLDFQPFSIVTDRGFIKLVNTLDPRYLLPSPFTLSRKMLNQFYNDIYNKLKGILMNVDYVAITCDGWTSRTTESYLTVTCHYIDKSYNLSSAVLSTKPLTNGVNHTSQNIAESLKEIFNEWDLEQKVSCIVTDNAANMIKACDLIQKRHLPCYAHTLNLIVQDNLVCVQEVIKKCKDIVTFFKSSTIATEMFQKEKETPEPYKLLQEVPTRWNSTLYMIQRILKTNDAIGRTILKLRKAPQPLSVDDIAVLTDIEKVLACFEEATKKISGNNYVTISLIIPISFGIYNILMKSLHEMNTEEGKVLCNRLIESVRKRLFSYEVRSPTRLATLLDPRFKKEGFRNIENSTVAATILEQEMFNTMQKNLNNQESQDSTTTTENPSDGGSNLFGFLEKRIESKVKSVTADIIITKRQYLERANSSAETDPLLFWKVTGKELSPLEECARKYLCVPATSVESERTFSAAGQIISERRSNLRSGKVNMLIFLNKNFSLTE